MARPVPLVDRRLRVAIAVLVAGAILVASITRPSGVRDILGPLGIVGLDKWLHALAYAALAVAIAYALAEWQATALVTAAAVFLLATAFGFGVELLQAAIPYRAFSRLDLLANALGASVGTVAWRAVADRLHFRRRSARLES